MVRHVVWVKEMVDDYALICEGWFLFGFIPLYERMIGEEQAKSYYIRHGVFKRGEKE
jgi:hypothetical protein